MADDYITTTTGGNKYYYNHRHQLHRDDGPAAEYINGEKQWWLNGELHREDGPAIEWADGTKYWYLNGLCHRDTDAAIEYYNGTKEWWWHGKQCTREEHCKLFFASRGIVDTVKPEPKPKPIIVVRPKLTRSILSLDD